MEYTIKKVADLSGVSTRTLRYYDEINLLKPARINSSGYRIYGKKEIDLLQQILFYRSLDMKLEEIQQLLLQPDFDHKEALKRHYQALIAKRQQIDQLILTVEKTIRYQKGEITMTDKEKFTALKQEQLNLNEQQFGREIREKYDEDTVNNANQKWLNLSEAEFQTMELTEKEMLEALKLILETEDYHSQIAETVFLKHKAWLNYTLPVYSAEIHQALGQMYMADKRFAAYYTDRAGEGAADALNKIIQHFAK